MGTWSAGATFGDYDGDGRLDLFVDGYARIDLNDPPVSGSKAVGYASCQFRGAQVMCGPRGLPGEHDHLFHNNGDGTFTDVSKKLGVDDPSGFYGLAVLFVDVNNDGKVDLLVANDTSPNYLYMNKGDGTFEDQSYMSGYALNKDGREIANMGIAVGDYENNGHLSVVNTSFGDDYLVLFQNDGTGSFSDVSYQSGVATGSIPFVKFADGFLDYDNDGWLDLLIVNGHVYPEVDQHPEWGTSYAERPLMYHNLKSGKFELMPAVEGTGLAAVTVGRGAAFGDIFNDGKIDVILNNMDGVPTLLRNVNSDHHHWVELGLVGGSKSPRDTVGATVYLQAGSIRERQDVLSGGSYLSSNDMRVHFGLADGTDAGTAEIHWPSGRRRQSGCRRSIAFTRSPKERASPARFVPANHARIRRQRRGSCQTGNRHIALDFSSRRISFAAHVRPAGPCCRVDARRSASGPRPGNSVTRGERNAVLPGWNGQCGPSDTGV